MKLGGKYLSEKIMQQQDNEGYQFLHGSWQPASPDVKFIQMETTSLPPPSRFP